MSNESSRGRPPSNHFKVIDQREFSSLRPTSTTSASHSILLPQYNILQKQMNSPQNSNPHHADNAAKDVARQISVYSSNRTDWTEVRALFVADLEKYDQNWISEDLVKRLQLNRAFNLESRKEYGRLKLKTFQFQGSLILQWTEKGGHKSKFTPCRIVPRNSFDLLLRSSLLPNVVLEKHALDVDLTPAPLLASLSLEETHLLTANTLTTSSVGSFHTEPKLIEDDSEEAIVADNWISKFKLSVHMSINKAVEKAVNKEEGCVSSVQPVKIAVLDTGVDLKHSVIMTAIQMKQIQKFMRSFVNSDKSVQDECGHGTHIASLLADIAPQAQIYIAKVAKSEEIPPDHHIAQAIEWATDELHVDIITMSFGLEKLDDNVQTAILRAFSKNIIMFSAASNRGGNSEVKYPANTDEVFCIYSTDGLGNPSDFNPTITESEGCHFATLGEGIKSAWPKKLAPSSAPSSPPKQLEQRMSGTSFAAPIAAATAACILEFALKNEMRETHGDLYKILRSRRGMRKVFEKLLAAERKEHHYVHPWKLFDLGGRSTDPNQYIFNLIVDLMDS